MKQFIFFLLLSFISPHCFAVELPQGELGGSIALFPENDEARAACKEALFSETDSQESPSKILKQRKDKRRVLFKVEGAEDHIVYLFLHSSEDGFGLERAGNLSLRRSRETGRFTAMTVLLRDDPACYARVTNAGDVSLLSITLFKTLLYRDIVIQRKLDELLFEPFRSVIILTRDLVDWEKILALRSSDQYGNINAMLAQLRKKMPELDDVDDGVMAGDGSFTFIGNNVLQAGTRGFNCSGFAKWIIDGFYYPIEGKFIDIERLKIKHLKHRGNIRTEKYEEARDPFFGLDWTRNCAITLEEARTGMDYADPEAFDVRSVDYVEYLEDIGFPAGKLELVLYMLAAEYPGYFYLGSINGDYGANPVLHQHFHVAAFLPYFDKNGNFRTAVVERNVQTSLDSIIDQYGGRYIHLVRIDSEGSFELRLY